MAELAVPRRRALRLHQPLVLQEPDLGDGDVRELRAQQREHRTDAHRLPVVVGVRVGPPRRRHHAVLTNRPSQAERRLGWKTRRYLPICTSSPSLRTASSIRSRSTYVPFRLPTSRTTNCPSRRMNSACLRETVTSSRKMSLSGRRPAVVRSASSRNRAPAFGPRWTTSRADCSGSASIAALSAPESPVSSASGGTGEPREG